MSNDSRPVYEQPIYKIIIPVRNLSLHKAVPQFAAAIDEQIVCDDARDDFIKEKLHSSIHSSNTDWMPTPQCVCALRHPLPFSIPANARSMFSALRSSASDALANPPVLKVCEFDHLWGAACALDERAATALSRVQRNADLTSRASSRIASRSAA